MIFQLLHAVGWVLFGLGTGAIAACLAFGVSPLVPLVVAATGGGLAGFFGGRT